MFQDGFHDADLGVRRRAQLVLLVVLGDGVERRSSSVSVTRTSTHSAGAIQPCASMSFHGEVEPLGPDQAEHIALTTVLTDQRRGKAQSAARLQVGGHRNTGAGRRCTSS